MKTINRTEISEMNKVYRLNLINSISGYKSANLIGTKGNSSDNLGIFSSVFHLGSNPPLLGMIMRPATVPRHSLSNIRESGSYTINHITCALSERAHYTSAKFDESVSEFEACRIEKEEIDDFPAPFVKESPIQLGMELRQEIPITANDTILIVGEIKLIRIKEDLIEENGQIDLNKAEITSISGLNTYHLPKQIANYPYARVEELPEFK